jgi:hypothetical protein
MTEGAAIFRAQLGAALRALPSELQDPEQVRSDVDGYVSEDTRMLAAQLDQNSPGLALMMQLRRRFFERTAGAAYQRGFDAVVIVGWGVVCFPIESDDGDGIRMRLFVVDHPAVLHMAAEHGHRPRGAIAVPAPDLERDAWTALADHVRYRPRRRMLFLVDGLSLWGTAESLSSWLRAFACSAAPGSEMLLNLLDRVGADHMRALSDWCARDRAPATPGIQGTYDRSRLAGEADAHGVEILGVFDSHTLQRIYLGVEDLLVREIYAWVRVPDGTSPHVRLPLDEMVAPTRVVAWPGAYRPHLHPRVELFDDGRATLALRLRVTSLRACGIALTRGELATASLFDGTRTIAEVETTIARGGVVQRDHSVSELLGLLRAHGLLRADPVADDAEVRLAAAMPATSDVVCSRRPSRDGDDARESHLGALWAVASNALQRNDSALARQVSILLAPSRGNVAVSHLCTLLRRARSIVFVTDGKVSVVAAPDMSREEARAVALTVGKMLRAIGRVLNAHFNDHVVIDLSSVRPGVPVTMVADAEPYTVVRIPAPSYSQSTLCHELTHAVAMCGSMWLSEGLAVWMQRLIAPGPCFPDDVADGAAGGDDVDDVSLEERLLGGARAHDREGSCPIRDRDSYRRAAAFVDWLVRRCGVEGFTRFFAAWRSVDPGRDADAACRAIAVVSLDALEAEWRRSG